MKISRDICEKEAKRISMLRMQLLGDHPFWGFLLMQLQIVPSRGIGAIAATDCIRNIFYDPTETSKLTNKQLGFVLLHELCHLAYATIPRQLSRDHFLWNCATDYAINRIVVSIPGMLGDAMYTPPRGILLDRKYDGMIAETIYESLITDPPDFLKPLRINIKIEDFNSKEEKDSVLEISGVMDHCGGIDIHLPIDLSDQDREDLESNLRAAVDYWNKSNKKGHIPGDIEREFSLNKSKIDLRKVLMYQVNLSVEVEGY